jgi:MFS transporter, DHA1 family, multidrug resistance protein
VPDAFGVSMRMAILGFTIPFFGVFFAPIFTPHLAEQYGRRPIYLTSIGLFSLCVVVIGLATDFSLLLAFRFLAGLFGGPCLVLIEGTFADLWSAQRTVTYYSFLTLASFFGAAFGPIIGNFVFTAHGPAWLAWVTLIFAVISIAYGAAMPETYGREILRTRIHYNRSNIKLPCAQSGVTLPAMVKTTFVTPLMMLVTEPLVIMISLYVGLNFAVVFQWFVSVPVALGMAYKFTGTQAGLAFFAAVGGATLALVTASLIEALSSRKSDRCDTTGMSMVPIERRLFSAMFGGVLVVISLFWVGFSVSPTVTPAVPIIGTGVYVWGNAMVLISLISYLFDAYPPAGTLSALTVAACFRILCAGIVPLYILDMITGLPSGWAFGTFGIISAVMLFFPIFLFFFGAGMRQRSKYSQGGMSTVTMQMNATQQGGPTARQGSPVPQQGGPIAQQV